jgi:hypothetical protein
MVRSLELQREHQSQLLTLISPEPCCADDCGKVRRNWQRLKRTYVGTPSVARWHKSKSGFRCRADDANRLTNTFSRASVLKAPDEHAPVNADMLQGGSLPEYMCALKVNKCL